MPLVVEEHSRFDDLRVEWEKILGKSLNSWNIFSTWDWQRLWWDTLSAGESLRLLAVRDELEIVGIWPLMEQGSDAFLVGGIEVCDYLDIIAVRQREPDVLAAGLAYLADRGISHLDLRFVPAESPTARYLPELAGKSGWQCEKTLDDVCPTIALPESWDAYLASLTKKDRHELRRKLRRLADAGSVEYHVACGPANVEGDTADFLRLHRSSGAEKAAFMRPAMEVFFRRIIGQFRPSGRIKLFFLAFDGKRVAATLCIDQPDELWVYNSGFDRDYASYSVGLAVKAYCIEHAIREGKHKIDYLRGREPYKYDLGARDVPVWRLQLRKS